MKFQSHLFSIRPVTADDLPSLLTVYRQCEDFLALGPQPRASAAMIQADLAQSAAMGGVFCGIFDESGVMFGVADFVPHGYQGSPALAFISLLMLARPYRCRDLGTAIMQAIEAEIRRDPRVTAILADVQVNNPGAARFWGRMGYWIVGGPEPQPDRTTVWLLRKELGQVSG